MRTRLVLFSVLLAAAIVRADTTPGLELRPPQPDRTLLTTNQVHLLTSGADDAAIARFTARVLQQAQYRRQPFDDSISSNFLARYMGDLDLWHIHFLQGDLKDFERYRFKLDDLTVQYGDTTPAYEIFGRFLQRVEQRVAYADELLKKEKFEFNGSERVTLDRRKLPYPKDADEARQLWRERLRFEYLQEKLNAESPAKPADTNAPAAKPRTPRQIHDDIVKALTRRYARVLHMYKEWDNADVLQAYLNSLAHVYDPYSDYFGKSQLDDFAMSMNLSLFGIGALLTSDEDGYCKIKELKPGPAQKSEKIKPNDRIIAVAQGTNEPVDVVDMQLSKVVQLIRGPKNTEVRLTIVPANATDPSTRKVVALVRDEIKLEDGAAKAKIIELPDAKGNRMRLGLIDLPSFYASFDVLSTSDKSAARSTTADVAGLIKKLEAENVSGIILDLRRNGGGSLEESIRLTGLFIKDGPVVQVRDPLGIVSEQSDTDSSVLYDGPLVVLTSRFSASASEILAGALQDYGRALIVGDVSTHGKGTVQSLTQLSPYLRNSLTTTNDPGALKITIRKFYRPNGSSTQLKGVTPDIVLPSVNNVADIGETAWDNPLPWDTIKSSFFDRTDRVSPHLDELRHRSSERVAGEKEFSYVREDIELFKKAQADKTVSLNEAQRLAEKKENAARQKARDQERAGRGESGQIVYELNLKQAMLPGLPPPGGKTNSAAAAMTAADGDKTPPVDVDLIEAEHILQDYISLLPKAVIAATKN